MPYKLISFGKIPSTQLYAHELIARGQAADCTVILADSQSAGRGRYKRTWVSHRGNLYVSFIYSVHERDPRLSYAVAVAIAETLISFGIRPAIKWPNDILIDGKKASGVLIEYAGDFVIVGIGINIKSSPIVAGYETAKLGDYADVGRDMVLSALMKNMDVWLKLDFGPVRQRWTDLAAGLNKTITYHRRPAELIGINEDGVLILRNGSEYIMAYGDEISI